MSEDNTEEVAESAEETAPEPEPETSEPEQEAPETVKAPTKGTECNHPSNTTGYHHKGSDGKCIYCGG